MLQLREAPHNVPIARFTPPYGSGVSAIAPVDLSHDCRKGLVTREHLTPLQIERGAPDTACGASAARFGIGRIIGTRR